MNAVCVGSIVHYVVTDGGGKRCCGAMVTDVADPTDAYRDRDYVGLRAWTDTDEIVRPLPLGGSRYDPGEVSDDAVWSCDGLDHECGTWHHISMLRYSRDGE